LIPNVTDKEIIPYMPFSLTTIYTTYSDIIQDWSMIIGKYTPVFTNELYDLRFLQATFIILNQIVCVQFMNLIGRHLQS